METWKFKDCKLFMESIVVAARDISFSRSHKGNDYEKQRYVNHHVFALAPLSYVSPGGRHRVWV
jgi:hypothetical protein